MWLDSVKLYVRLVLLLDWYSMVKKGTFRVSQLGYTSGSIPSITTPAAVRKQSTYDMEEDAPVQQAAGTQEDTPVQQAAAIQAGKLRANSTGFLPGTAQDRACQCRGGHGQRWS